jgi:hypothetical protein
MCPILNFDDANALQDALPGRIPTPVAPQTAPNAPDALDVASAALRQGNIVSSLYDRTVNNPDSTAPARPDYDAFQDIGGFENYASRFSRSTSPEQTQVIKNRITGELQDRDTLSRAGGYGVAASFAAGAIDPLTIASMAIPVAPALAGASRLARVGAGVLTNVAAGEVQHAALNSSQELPDDSSAALRIGGNALLAGVFGTLATRVPRAAFQDLAGKVGADISAPYAPAAHPSGGAAAVAPTTLADESIARGGQTIADTIGQVSPLTRIMTGPSLEGRQLAQQLADVPYFLEKNFEGVATPSSVESRVTQLSGQRDHAIVQGLDSAYADYKTGGGDLSHSDFSEAISQAMRRGDKSDIPQVQKIAQDTRPIFNADREALQKVGALPEDLEVLGAESYFPRVYNQEAISAGRTDLEQRLTSWFTENPSEAMKGRDFEPGEQALHVRDAVYQTLDRIQGTVRGTADLGHGVKNPSLLKARVLDVPDNILEPYLSSDYEHVMHAYNASAIPQIEMRKAFGSTTLENEFKRVTSEFHDQIAAAPSDKAKASLTQQHAETLENLTALRDRVLNQAGPKGDVNVSLVRLGNLAMGFNYLRMLGGQVTSAIPDAGRLIARYGLLNTGARTARYLADWSANVLIREDAKRMGTALDWTLHTRAKTLAEIGDQLGGSKAEQYMHNATANFTRISGIATWDSMLRGITSALEQDAIFKAVSKQRLSAMERAKLAQHGIGDAELPAIRAQWLEHGQSEGGLNRARTDLWTDKDAASLVEQAVVRAGNTMAFAIGKGDLPLMMNSSHARMLLQFKSFAISSVNRMVTPLMQGVAHGDIASINGMVAMLTLGGMAYAVKEIAAGRKPDFNPRNVIAESVQRSGLLGFLPDLYDPVAGMAHLPRFSKFQDISPIESAAGPTAGTLATLMNTVKGFSDGSISAADMHKMRQLLPFQNLFYMRYLINALEGKAADAIDAKDATHQSMASRLTTLQAPEVAKADKKHLLGVQAIPNHF